MDHKAAYAHHIAMAIRHKKSMRTEEPEEVTEEDGEDYFPAEAGEAEQSAEADPKAKMRERLKAILAK